MLTTDQKGAIAELAIAHAAAELGVGVFKPLTAGERYDLIFDLRSQLVRVQCKSAGRRGEVVVVRCRSCRRVRGGGQIQRPYTAAQVDAIAAYCVELGRAYFIPLDEITRRSSIQLRLSPARNQQRAGVLWADDFAFEARLTALRGP
ncbi:MAG TPA: group I intron-associated PD-(D/E)XK endonuclease [Gaiellaceae bacterium]|nr:group I intron-associated PD-(D/E)XK endonuclease [Gaiellaceae bacterium]